MQRRRWVPRTRLVTLVLGMPDPPTALSFDEVLTTTRAVRRRLDFERPVERRVVEECLHLAFQAPNGANDQSWGWVLIDDKSLRGLMLADLYRKGMADHIGRDRTGEAPDATSPDERMSASVQYLADNMERVPVLVVPTVARRYGAATTFAVGQSLGWRPAVWSLHLALRSRGLGSAWTTLHLYREEEAALGFGHPVRRAHPGRAVPGCVHPGDDVPPRRSLVFAWKGRVEPLAGVTFGPSRPVEQA